MMDVVPGLCRNVADIRDKLREIAVAMKRLGLHNVANELHLCGDAAFANAEALYRTILEMRAAKDARNRRTRKKK